MNKITQELNTLLQNRLTYLYMQKEIAVRLGNIESIATLDTSIQEVEATLLLLNSSS